MNSPSQNNANNAQNFENLDQYQGPNASKACSIPPSSNIMLPLDGIYGQGNEGSGEYLLGFFGENNLCTNAIRLCHIK